MQKYFFLLLLLMSQQIFAQKKQLDHTVYDNWKSIGERAISNDGQYVVYTVNPQEGDGELVIQNPLIKYKKVVPRGYQAIITEDSKFVIFRIKPLFKDTRLAKIKKKKADDMPNDSLAIIELGKDSILKKARINSFKVPFKASGFIAYQLAKATPDSVKKKTIDSVKTKNDPLVKLADSLIKKSIDSIKGNISKEELTAIINKAAAQILKEGKDVQDAEGEESSADDKAAGGNLYVRSLIDGHETLFKNVGEYFIDQKGTNLLMEIPKVKKDSNSIALVLLYHFRSQKTDTIFRRFNDAKNYVFDEEGDQLAFVAERDSSEKALTKFYKLYYYSGGQDSVTMIADKNAVGMQLGYTVSDNSVITFSKDGNKLFFGNSPVRSPKDTTLVDFETAKLDVWNYKDDYLQTQQLKNAEVELRRSYTAVYQIPEKRLTQLGGEDAELITRMNEGNSDWVLAETNRGNRIDAQWTGRTKNSAFVMNINTGEKKIVFKNLFSNPEPSPAGKFIYWYNPELKNYFTYEIATGTTRNITDKIKSALYDEENDSPDFADEYGTMGWLEGDSALYVYDKYDSWKVSPDNSFKPSIITLTAKNTTGRANNEASRFIKTDQEQRFFTYNKQYLFSSFNRVTKEAGLYLRKIESSSIEKIEVDGKSVLSRQFISKNNNALIFSKENYQNAPDIYYTSVSDSKADEKISDVIQLSDINPQQKNYNWGTAELFKWKTYNGKATEGIVYKPENFDPKKKYPLICYFYEKLSDGLYNYIAPAPTPSRLNISFFVSRGYVVLAPDISYTVGHPGNSAYDYIVSGARALVKKRFVDSTKIGLQGQSWGGYQTAYLITRTKLFKAAWAGAPVANMTSAYGGIRWESGLNRQFQYEKTQSRIGATLWEKPQLYIENSPLFHLPKVQTPLVIMANDADGAVPWYQGIELFTSLRRLGKPVWMLNYNGEAHNLVERRNRKDIQIREQQFFDWLLKGEAPAKWLTDGVPAIDKGKDWGLKTD